MFLLGQGFSQGGGGRLLTRHVCVTVTACTSTAHQHYSYAAVEHIELHGYPLLPATGTYKEY